MEEKVIDLYEYADIFFEEGYENVGAELNKKLDEILRDIKNLESIIKGDKNGKCDN
jgi:hypothetical protein